MNAQVEDLSSTRKRLKIRIPENVITSELDARFRELNRTAKVPGFRPGRVPRNVLEKRYGRDVRAEILDRLVPDYYGRALREAGLHPVAMPKFESPVKLDGAGPVDMTLTVEVRPKVEPLVYEGLELERIPTEPREDELDKALESIRREKATLEPSETAEEGGRVVVDYDAFEGEERIEEISGRDFEFDLAPGDLPEAFVKETVGKKSGDRYEFTVDYPADHPGEKVAGKTVRFEVSLKETKRRVLPEADDALAAELGFGDLGKLKERIRENIEGMKKARAAERYRFAASERLLEKHDFDLPEELLEREIALRMEEARSALPEGETAPPDEALRKQVLPEARKSLKGQILVELIGEREGITVEEDDIKRKLAEISTTAGIAPEALVQYYSQNREALERLRNNIFETKTLDRVVSKATFIDKEPA